jgi:inosine-uridine nucleoside N-ribohydrolase
MTAMNDSPESGGQPSAGRHAPVIIDTDVGDDPDDAVALTVAARCLPGLALVLTTDEVTSDLGFGQRARFARLLLDLAGRPDVPVVAGAASNDKKHLVVDRIIPSSVPTQPRNVVSAVRHVCAATSEAVRWIGIGAMSNLAHLLREAPDVTTRLRITQMGGALAYRDAYRAEHNIRADVSAAHQVLSAVAAGALSTPEWITSDVTFTPLVAINAESEIYRRLRASSKDWALLLVQHMDGWFDRAYPSTMQHDALTLSAAMDLPFVRLGMAKIALDEIGRMSTVRDGVPIRLSTSVRYDAFMDWLTVALDPSRTPTSTSCTSNVEHNRVSFPSRME